MLKTGAHFSHSDNEGQSPKTKEIDMPPALLKQKSKILSILCNSSPLRTNRNSCYIPGLPAWDDWVIGTSVKNGTTSYPQLFFKKTKSSLFFHKKSLQKLDLQIPRPKASSRAPITALQKENSRTGGSAFHCRIFRCRLSGAAAGRHTRAPQAAAARTRTGADPPPRSAL